MHYLSWSLEIKYHLHFRRDEDNPAAKPADRGHAEAACAAEAVDVCASVLGGGPGRKLAVRLWKGMDLALLVTWIHDRFWSKEVIWSK